MCLSLFLSLSADSAHLEILLVLVGQRAVDLLDPPVGGDVVALRLRVEVHDDVLAVRDGLHDAQEVEERLVQIDLRKRERFLSLTHSAARLVLGSRKSCFLL